MPKPEAERRTPVVGIGASAGGLQALQRLFQNLPADLGAAYVVIVHLAPDRDSELPAILRRETKMPVIQVADHSRADLLPDHIYVIAPDRKLELTDTSVGASSFDQPRGQRAAVDLFFRSLCSAQGDIFAVILSGGGSDGAIGAKAVKEAGGLVLVQDPSEAAHESMPRSAIATGAADVVLPVQDLARRLAELIRNRESVARLLRRDQHQAPVEQDEEAALQSVLELLRRRTSNDFSKYKRNTVLRRLARRMQLSHVTTIPRYLHYLEENVEEVQALLNDLLITVTTFFRDADAWSALREHVVAPLVQRTDPAESIRCWVPGCATGEEAYSLAIVFAEEMERARTRQPVTIFASDVDERALNMAREGVYPSSISADVSDERLKRWFRATDDHYRVATELRDRVVFASHSLQRDPPFSRLHLISCRNLLIYLNRELQDQVMAIFRYACREDGHLFLGSSEAADAELFSPVDKQHRIYQARPRTARPKPVLPDLAATVPQIRWSRAAQPPRRDGDIGIHRTLLEEQAPPSVVVDEHWQVLTFSETAGRFFQHPGGPPTDAAADTVRPELRGELIVALRHAFEAREPYLSEFVPVRFNGTPRRVGVLVQPHTRGEESIKQALVTFLEAGPAPATPPAEGTIAASNAREQALIDKLHQAEQHIDHLRADHHAAEEDLHAANEELQSLNEEYRSTTEELETSKEELQSINEELQTVNVELKVKLEEVSHAHDDLENLMAATDIATLFVDRNLCIKRFTPKLAEIFNVKSSDRDRPIGDLTHSLHYQDLTDDAQRVLANLAPVEREVRSIDERYFILQLRPYRTADDRIDGVVITLVDVTELKQAEHTLREADERKDEFLGMLAHELRNPLAAIRNSALAAETAFNAEGAVEPAMVQKVLAVVERQSRHMARLVDDLLDITRITRNKLSLRRQPTDVGRTIAEVTAALRPDVERARVNLELDLPDTPLTADADPERLAQILDNLLQNAVNFTQPGGKISISARPEDGQALIVVRDTGIGIEPEHIESLFEAYRQVDEGRRSGGLGLGLSLVKRLVDLHGGTIVAHSDGLGHGSEFRITLPLADPPPVSQSPTPTAAQPRPRRILVVDDQADVADAFASMLKGLGQDVLEAYSGDEALKLALERRPEVAFLDLAMPGMSGRDLAEQLRRHFPPDRLTLVALSGFANDARARGEPFQHYIVKPAEAEGLRDLLNSLRD